MRLFDNQSSAAGKVTVSILIAGFAIFAVLFLINLEEKRVSIQVANAQTDTATTSVNVLNTAPVWTVDAQEQTESSTSSPTNATTSLTWHATGTDSNGEDYWLLICATNVAPTANMDAPPTCDGGAANTWAVSATTTSGTVATATYTTLVSDAERNEWYASICDGNTGFPRCNTDIQQGSGSTISPFHVNHRPSFDFIWNDGPVDPGGDITWTATATDADTLGSDTVQVFICSTQDFDYTIPDCTGTQIASSTLQASDPATTTTIAIPTQDATYNAYAFVLDNHGFHALESSTEQATNSPYTVNNVAPTVLQSEVVVNSGSDMILTAEQGLTTGFHLTYIVSDNNSCVANGSTTQEFSTADISAFRASTTWASCNQAGEFDVNDCYTNTASTSYFTYSGPVATSSVNECTGPNDTNMAFEWDFSLWYTADPTDGVDGDDSPWWAEEWLGGVIVGDDDGASSTAATSSSGVEVNGLLAFAMSTTSISYGSVEPGNTTTPIVATTTILATGNVGLDEGLDGEDMCTDYTTFDSCYDPSPANATSTILVGYQVYAGTSTAYTAGTALTAASTEFEVNVLKTTVTTTPAEGQTIWGIAVPDTIQLSGTYLGQNTFTAIRGEGGEW
jgi:hypothetical protein